MGPFKLKKSSLISALIISIGTIIFQFVFFLFFFEVPKPKITLMLCVEFFVILFLAYVILSLSFERFLVSRVKELYKSLIPTTSYINSINQGKIFVDLFTKKIKTRLVNFPFIGYDPFFNVNNKDDLAEANKLFKILKKEN